MAYILRFRRLAPLKQARWRSYMSSYPADTPSDWLYPQPPPPTIKASPSHSLFLPHTSIMPMDSYPIHRDSTLPRISISSDTGMKDSMNFLDSSSYDMLSPDGDQLIFGPLEFDEGPLLSPSMPPSWDSPNDFTYHHPLSPPASSDHTPSPHRLSDFDIPDTSPNNSFYDSAFGRFDDMHSMLDLDGAHFSHWLNEPVLDSPTSPIPIRGAGPDPQSPSLFSYPNHTFTPSASFSPSEFAAPHQLPRSLSPADGSDGYLSSPGLRVASISPADTSLRPPPWATQLWDSSHYEPSSSTARVHQPLSEHPYGVKRQRFQPRRDMSTLGFQSSSAPIQTGMPSMMRNYSSRRGESVSVSDDRDATVRRKKRLSTEELSREEKSADLRMQLSPSSCQPLLIPL
jgi:hypothetical protein